MVETHGEHYQKTKERSLTEQDISQPRMSSLKGDIPKDKYEACMILYTKKQSIQRGNIPNNKHITEYFTTRKVEHQRGTSPKTSTKHNIVQKESTDVKEKIPQK